MKIILFILTAILLLSSIHSFPKILWTYQRPDIKNEHLKDIFDENLRVSTIGWELNFLNDDTMKQYLQKIPYYDRDIEQLKLSEEEKQFYVKLLILSHYGGVWLDPRILIIQDFSWLQLQRLQNNRFILNKSKKQPKLLFFENHQYSQKQYSYVTQLKRYFQNYPSYNLWFIAAEPGSQFLRDLLKQFKSQIKNRLFSLKEKQFILLSQSVLQQKQRQLSKQGEKQPNQDQELATVYYGIWHIACQNGPSYFNEVLKGQQIYQIARQNSQSLLKIYGSSPKYFIYLNDNDLKILYAYFYRIQGWNFGEIYMMFKHAGLLIFQKWICPQKYAIYTPSILYQKIIGKNSIKFNTDFIQSPYKLVVSDLPCTDKIFIFKVLSLWGIFNLLLVICVVTIVFINRRKKSYVIIKQQDQSQIQIQNEKIYQNDLKIINK